MKKHSVLIILAMVAALALTLVGCGGNSSNSVSSSSESKVDVNLATEFDAEDFFKTQSENEAKAKSEYDGNVYKVSGVITEIHTDYIIIDTVKIANKSGGPLEVHMSTDEIAKLSKGDSIVVIGVFKYVDKPWPSRINDAAIV